MFVLLGLLLTLSATFTFGTVIEESNGVGARQTALDGFVFNSNVLFGVNVSSTVKCASSCLKDESCLTFTTSPKEPTSQLMICRGHDIKMTSGDSKVALAGSRTYYMGRPTSALPSWLGTTCADNSDCPETNSECFKGECLCTPGYYYSTGSGGCVLSCSTADLQSTFLRYPQRHISGHNIETVYNCDSFDYCKQRCLANSRCRSLDLELSIQMCWLQEDTAIDAPDAFEERLPSEYYQRTCL